MVLSVSRKHVGSKVCLEGGVISLLDQIKTYPYTNFSSWQILANLGQVKKSAHSSSGEPDVCMHDRSEEGDDQDHGA